MNAIQIELVQATFAKLAPISDAVATTFYERLFRIDPQIRMLFKDDLVEQRTKLMQMLGMCVRGLARIDHLVPVIRDLGRRHAKYGTKSADFNKVGAALMATLRHHLQADFTEATEVAWSIAFETLAAAMCLGLAEDLLEQERVRGGQA